MGSHLIVLAGDLSITPYLITSGIFETPLTNFFLKRVKPGDVVFDIGANSGYNTMMLRRLVGPHGKVVAYEPDPTMLRKGMAGTVIFEWARQALNENTDTFVALLGELSNQSGRVFYYLDAEGNPIPTTLADFTRADFIHSVLLSKPL